MENRKLLSIVVPTKDRYKYLKSLIELVRRLDSEDVELVIQDNSDDNSDFLEYLKNLNYDFIRYNHIKGQIPMAINSDKAILNSTGEYICFLGDDDGLTKYILDCVRWMKSNNVEAVKSSEVFYYWPDVALGNEKAPSSTLKYMPFDGSITYLNPYDELIKVLKNGIPNRGRMPLVYHSIVRRDALDRIYDKLGTYFPGNSPDISNAVALSLVVKKYAFVNLPLAYSGCSVFHGGGVHANKNSGHPAITDIPWFRPDAAKKWDKKIPRIAPSSFIWSDSVISALRQMGRDDLYDVINFYKMYARFSIANPNYRNLVLEVCDNKMNYYFVLFVEILNKYISALFRRIGWSTKFIKKSIVKRDINNIIDSTVVLEHIVKDNIVVFK